MPIIDNPKLYERVKTYADKIYKKSSAYKSGFIVKTYKELGGTYTDDNQPKNLARWYKEIWRDIGNKEYPVYRPTKRINSKTPLTVDEIDKEDLKKQIAKKQIIKGDTNLKPFKKKQYEITDYTYKKAKQKGVDVVASHNPKKKIDVIKDGKVIATIGDINYFDYPTYLETKGITKEYADNRRRLYKIRHTKDRQKLYSNGWWSDYLLW
jgi:hypothetical protein